MTKHTIDLDGTFVVAKGPRNGDWKAEVAIDLAVIPTSIARDLLLHGLKQKVADAASGAQTEAEAQGAMQKAVDAVLAGEWSSRGEGVSDRTKVERAVARDVLRAKLDKAEWKAFTEESTMQQNKRLDDIYAKNAAKLSPVVDKRIADAAKERAERAALVDAVDI